MKELLKEIEHYSFQVNVHDIERSITLEDLKQILSRYEVVSKDNQQPYTT